ncbi:hypothetical protein ABC255_02150 [Neobacillus sp. 3P2-tot-E-2]|uniref:hypothetical protein n=1 Tax=Neobacillus sp. 3P2-tot-E-2 TaxID=3132212 RepID=UPI0039A251F6
MTNTVDLNELQRVMLQNQRNGVEHPHNPNQKISVTREGKIVQGDSVSHPPEVLSEVPQGTFANVTEQRPVHPKLPSNTLPVNRDGFNGFLYSIKDPFGQVYSMFLYFDGSYYQVKLVYPKIDKNYNIHDCHLYRDGRLCLNKSTNGGYASLEKAYAKSVIWAAGFTAYRQTGTFPFAK